MRIQSFSFTWVLISFLLLLGYLANYPGIDAHATTADGTADCDPQSIPAVDCPATAPAAEESNNNYEDNSGNIEEEIPSVIPFP